MRRIAILSLLLSSASYVIAQADVKVWTRTTAGSSYDFGHCVAADNFGNSFIAGGTQGTVGAGGNAGRYDMFVAKYNSAGNQLWVRQRGSDQREFAYGAGCDAAGNIYLTGYTGADLDGNNNIGNWDIFLMKFDANGNWQWTKQDGTSQDDEGRALTVDSAGNVYIAGYVRGNFHGITRVGTADVFISKYNSSGTRLWSVLFGAPEIDEAFGIACDSAGNVFVTGWTDGSIEGLPNLGNGDNFLAKYDTNGQRLWLRVWGTVNKDTGYALACDAAGNVYVSGYCTGSLYGPPLGERDAFLAKYDAAGNPLWGKKFGTGGHDEAFGLGTDQAGNAYVSGRAAGSLDGNTHYGGDDVFLSKYDPTGTRLWSTQYGTPDSDWSDGLAISTNGIFVGGWSWGSLEGNANQGLSDAFITRFAFATEVPPPPPTVKPAIGVSSNAFTANWSTSGIVTGSRLDVSANADFNSFLPGYQNLDVGNVTNRPVTGLLPMTTYYYRLRAYNTNGTSGTSSTAAVTLASANPCASLLNANFENGFSLAGGGYIANGWIEWETDPGVVIGFDEAAIIHGGAHSQRIRISGGTNGSSGGVYQRVPVVPGVTYTISVWIYAADDRSACYLGVDPAGGTNANVGVTWSSVTTNVGWVQKTWTGTPTAGLLTVYFKVAATDTTRRNGYFDDAAPGASSGPILTLQRNAGDLTLTWPQCPPARLEQTLVLTESPIWTTPTNQVNFIGNQKTVTLTPAHNAAYFRLVVE